MGRSNAPQKRGTETTEVANPLHRLLAPLAGSFSSSVTSSRALPNGKVVVTTAHDPIICFG